MASHASGKAKSPYRNQSDREKAASKMIAKQNQPRMHTFTEAPRTLSHRGVEVHEVPAPIARKYDEAFKKPAKNTTRRTK